MPEVLPSSRSATDAYSYACHGCGRCCYHKSIRVTPYGVARIAEALGRSTTDVLATEVDPETSTLFRQGNGACQYLQAGQCTVHSGRPLACRLYPLGWVVTPSGGELFVERTPHPQTEGVYGTDGTVADYLAAQGAAPHQHAARRYETVLRRLRAAAEVDGDDPGEPPPLTDVDAAVTADCAARGVPVPDDVEARVDLHLALLHQWLDAAGAPPSSEA